MDLIAVITTLFFRKIEIVKTVPLRQPTSEKQKRSLLYINELLNDERSKEKFNELVKIHPITILDVNEIVICKIKPSNAISKEYLKKFIAIYHLKRVKPIDLISFGIEKLPAIIKENAFQVTLYDPQKSFTPFLSIHTKEGSFIPESMSAYLNSDPFYGAGNSLTGTFLFTRV